MSESPTPESGGTPEPRVASVGPLLPAPLPRPVAAVELVVVLAAMYLLTVVPRSWLNHGLDLSDRWWKLFALTRSGAVDCVLIVLLAIVLLRMRRLSLRWLGLSEPALGRQFAWAAAGVVCAYAFQVTILIAEHLLLRGGPRDDAESSASELVSDLVSTPHKGTALLLLLVCAIREELLFRVLILRYLTWLLRDPPMAVIISSLAFAATHVGHSDWNIAGALWVGLVLGTLYVRRGSLITVIAAHFLFNVLQTLQVTLL